MSPVDIFKITKSKTRIKILRLFLKNPAKKYYLRQLSRLLNLSPGNIKRELVALQMANLFDLKKVGKLLYYEINKNSIYFEFLNKLLIVFMTDQEKEALKWQRMNPVAPQEDYYCQTRDIFAARLESILKKLEKQISSDAYLLTAVIGEIGNNSFDHNLGNWPDIPGIFFGIDYESKKIVLADRGQGILNTLSKVYPDLKSHLQALKVAFTKTVSGRYPEKRGNGLKFVAKVVKQKNWHLKFLSGNAQLILNNKKMVVSASKFIIGCLAVIKY